MNIRASYIVPAIFLLLAHPGFAQESQPNKFLAQLNRQSNSLTLGYGSRATSSSTPPIWSDLAISFALATRSLKPVPEREVWRRRNPRTILNQDEYEKLTANEKKALQKMVCDESVYYGAISTPLAWARAFDRLGQHGVNSFDGKRVLDFGFGNVGQLHMIASLGADVTGVEIENSLARAMYRLESDQGAVDKLTDNVKNEGSLSLAFGKWPAEEEIVNRVGGGYDIFISKNVLKYGYVHPERKAPASQLIDLGVDDETFLKQLHRILNPGGYVLVYNIHPPKASKDETYKPWAYGETPWDRKLVEKVGFEVAEWHVDDSEAIHDFGSLVGWDSSFEDRAEFETNFRAMYTILKKSSPVKAAD
jgi:SAM-dependent methyltransferase